ncbi:lipase family alpha/beta hydrolase [Kibdelosporangium aridum]|uniref:Triacylglycerol esterase/lipase EstA, alpha/beta hydrolase fold n=1 Tax=Kibdelosporangium aridum TaxID=2030 RepID=A0A1W2FYC6_KIBAR|nr:alpha/beta fold hydrolase [Kibdelosporangium aridum]SMD26742.1 Triacylglycerol esterase/lipase EstA, alpha/beta hydrolase fold [Kibdelosporangium aridum]
MRPALLGSVAVVLALILTAPSAAATDRYPVSYGLAGLAKAAEAQLTRPGSAPPGANNWSCKPSAAHPDPVVLVHGFTANMTANWQTVSPLLANNGYCVFALTYGVPAGTPFPLDQVGGRNPMEQSAAELGAFIDRVLAATGARKVDIVGHSEGSLMPNYYVKFLGGAAKVSDYVGLTPLWNGTNLAALATLYGLGRALGLGPLIDLLVGPIAPAAPQFLAGSPFLKKLAEGGVADPNVTYTTIMTKYDELVIPYTSGYLRAPNATDVVLQNVCPQDYAGHAMVAFDPNATQVILNALDPANAKPVRCHFVPVSP